MDKTLIQYIGFGVSDITAIMKSLLKDKITSDIRFISQF